MSTSSIKVTTNGDSVHLERKCPFCGKTVTLDKPAKEYFDGIAAMSKGALVQNAFSTWTPNEREFIITGICQKCFDNL